MSLIDFFKKRENNDYDPLNISAKDLKKGYLFDYDEKTWEIEEEFEYDWGDENFTYEFKIHCGDEYKFLHIENDDEGVVCSLTEKLPIHQLDEKTRKKLSKKGQPPKKIKFRDTVFYKTGTHYGYYRNIDSESFEEFVNWDYEDENQEKILQVEQWSDENFELSFGKYVEESEITNILPRS